MNDPLRLLAPLLLLAAASAACGSTVVDPAGSGGGGAQGTTTTGVPTTDGSGGEGGGGAGPPSGLVHWDRYGDGSTEFVTSTTSAPPMEDRVSVAIVDNGQMLCTDPVAFPACPTPSRVFTVSMPASRYVMGAALDLTDTALWITIDQQGVNDDGATCWWAPPYAPAAGTLTLLAAGQGTLDVDVEGTGEAFIDGPHTLPVCD